MWLLALDLIMGTAVIKYSLSQPEGFTLKLSNVFIYTFVEQKLPNKVLPYTVTDSMEVTWRNILSFAHLEAEEIVEEMGWEGVDPLLCELCVLPRAAPSTSVPRLLHHDTERKGYHQKTARIKILPQKVQDNYIFQFLGPFWQIYSQVLGKYFFLFINFWSISIEFIILSWTHSSNDFFFIFPQICLLIHCFPAEAIETVSGLPLPLLKA